MVPSPDIVAAPTWEELRSRLIPNKPQDRWDDGELPQAILHLDDHAVLEGCELLLGLACVQRRSLEGARPSRAVALREVLLELLPQTLDHPYCAVLRVLAGLEPGSAGRRRDERQRLAGDRLGPPRHPATPRTVRRRVKADCWPWLHDRLIELETDDRRALDASAATLRSRAIPQPSAVEAGETTGQRTATALRSHQFIPVWLGAAAASDVVAAYRMTAAQPTSFQHCQVPSPSSDCTCELYVWPHGVVIFHVVDERSFPSLAALALWRERTYAERLSWVSSELQPVAPGVRAAYVLSLYWLTKSAWSAREYDTAMRLVCMPRVLLSRYDDDREGDGDKHAEARLAEDALLAARWDHPGVHSFGVVGTSSGYASWGGRVYHAQSAARALGEDELVAHELALQSVWTYCAHLNDEIEHGRDPSVPDDWGWRYLRGARCRLANPRPQESGQLRSMREIILKASGVLGQLDQAIETLREGPR